MKYETFLKWVTILFFSGLIISCLLDQHVITKEPMDMIDDNIFLQKIDKQMDHLKSIQIKLDVVKRELPLI